MVYLGFVPVAAAACDVTALPASILSAYCFGRRLFVVEKVRRVAIRRENLFQDSLGESSKFQSSPYLTANIAFYLSKMFSRHSFSFYVKKCNIHIDVPSFQFCICPVKRSLRSDG